MWKCQSLETRRYFFVYNTISNASFFINQVLFYPDFTVPTLGNRIICWSECVEIPESVELYFRIFSRSMFIETFVSCSMNCYLPLSLLERGKVESWEITWPNSFPVLERENKWTSIFQNASSSLCFCQTKRHFLSRIFITFFSII